jgi:hypothetical protein
MKLQFGRITRTSYFVKSRTRFGMTQGAEAAIRPSVGRKKRWHEVMGAPFPKGTFARMDAVLKTSKDGKGEDRTDFVREAVEREIARRQKAKEKPRRSGA